MISIFIKHCNSCCILISRYINCRITSAFYKAKTCSAVYFKTFIYLFCARITAKTLIAEWLRTISFAFALPFVPQFERLSQVVEYVLYLGKTRPIAIAIDECQDLNCIEPSFWSEVQRIWDLNKKSSQTLWVMSGSVAAAMRNIFQGYSEPLYGRVDRFVFVRPFPIQVLKEILSDYSATSTNEELRALYTLTGGVVSFVEELMD